MTNDTFRAFGLAPSILSALDRAGMTTPTPIQAQAIAPQLEGRDILGIAQTGTGKTAAFALPILHQILDMPGRPSPKTTRALVLAPTRELAVQIEEAFRKFADGARLSTALVLGGVSRNSQIRRMARGVDVLVATPGRLTDLVGEGHIRLDETRFAVLDEADRMLDMGFVREVKKIHAALHPRRQSALFSATMPTDVAGLAEGFLRDPVRIAVAPQGETAGTITQSVEVMQHAEKRFRLAELVGSTDVSRVIVFARTKRGADRVAENLGKDGVPAEAIHGNKAQNARQRALDAFRSGRVKVLVATDIAARGIDVPGISHVVNYELPDEAESYVHRIGRTGRNGLDGIAITLCAPDEGDKLRAIEKLTRQQLAPEGFKSTPSTTARKGRGGGNPAKPHSARRAQQEGALTAKGPRAPSGKPAGVAAARRRPRRTGRSGAAA
ncbi:DEAD/DEAH box helicase [Paroceanicella profunda]|uniref:DEAD/DEAH box helicase n=1 Tax=Paroceanicella profunda TaxID=2579971 RepID=UPI001EF1217B|nr:DEAD/DEAH box helicase [Paroceanicella profunda]